jgi:ribosomal protein S27E
MLLDPPFLGAPRPPHAPPVDPSIPERDLWPRVAQHVPADELFGDQEAALLLVGVPATIAILVAVVLELEGMNEPAHVEKEFRDYLICGDLSRGFARVRCSSCGHEILVAFSCKNRGLCPSCTTRRMSDGAVTHRPRNTAAVATQGPLGVAVTR